jgi:hypothetical protein
MLDHLLASRSESIRFTVDLDRYLENITRLTVVEDELEERLEILISLEEGCPGGMGLLPISKSFSEWLGNLFDEYGRLVPSPMSRSAEVVDSTSSKPVESSGKQLERWMEAHPLLYEWILAYTHADKSIVMMFPAEFERMRQQINAKFRDLGLVQLLPHNLGRVKT